MAHNLEMSESGQVAFALRGAPAWHNLANVNYGEDDVVTTTQMLEDAFLNNWNVRLEKIQYPADYTTVSDAYSVVRTHPFEKTPNVLSVVGERYKVVQNEDLFAFGDNILDGGAKWESAGSIKNGRVVFGSLVIPKEFILDPAGIADKTVTYLLVHTSHDGSTAIQANVTPVRVVCQNTLNMALNGPKQSFKIRHTQTVAGRIDQARHALGLAFDYMNTFETMAQDMFKTEITNAQFDKLVADLYPKPDAESKMATTKYIDKIDTIQNLYKVAATQNGIRGTKWGALNALTERVDYYRTARTGNTDSLMASASGFDVQTNAEKGRILKAVLAL